MTQVTASRGTGPVHPLVERITRMRGRVRTVVGLFGVGVLVATGVGGLVALMLGDYLVHFNSGAARVTLLLVLLAVLAVLAWRFLIYPLSTRLTDQFLASRVENVHKDLQDELISAVHFIHAGTIKTNALAARHVDAAAVKTAGINFEEAVDFQRSSKSLMVAAFVVLAAAVLFGMNPGLGRIALSRWFSGNAMPWPRNTHVMFAWGTQDNRPPAVLPIGEQVVVRAKVVQGGSPSQRVWLTTWGDNESAHSDLMTFQQAMSTDKEFVYERTLEPQGEKQFSMKLEAGDDTEQSPVNIRLAPRPEVRELAAKISPPDYVRDLKDPSKPAAAVAWDMMIQKARAVEGGAVTLRVRSSKAFMLDSQGLPVVQLLAQAKDADVAPGMGRKLLEPTVAELTFAATKSWDAHVVLRDTDNFENRSNGTISLVVVPDGLPSVVITDPRRQVDRSPNGSVDITIQATDDLGLDGIKLVAEKYDAKPGDMPVFEQLLTWGQRNVDPASGNTTGQATYTWDLEALQLPPGTRLSFYAMVQDNYNVNGKRHDWVKSAALTLQILSQEQIEENERQKLEEIKTRIEGLTDQQAKTQQETDVIQKAAANSGVTTPQQKEQLSQLAQQQNQEAAQANGIQQKVDQIQKDLKENKMAESELGKLAKEVSAGMKDVGQQNMPKAATDLSQAHESAGNQDPKDNKDSKQEAKAQAEAKQTAEAAKNASQQQGEAIAKMQDMADKLAKAGGIAAAKKELEKIQKKQDDLKKQTDSANAKNAGKDPSQLSAEDKKDIDKIAKEQQDLRQKTDDLIKQMDKQAEAAKPSDPAMAQSMAQAAKAGKASDVPGKQAQASKQAKENKTAKASDSQSQAQQGLKDMMKELQKNDDRELEKLQRDLAELIDQVKQLKAGEETLKLDTVTMGDKGTKAMSAKQGDRQGTLQMNTIIVQKKAEHTKEARPAAGDIRDAGEQMAFAANGLYGNKQPTAIEPETKAIASLDEAIKKLEVEKEKADEQAKDNALAEFIKEYQAILDSQKVIKTSSDEIETARQASPDKEIDRQTQTLVLPQLATDQGGLSAKIATLSSDDKLKEYDVIIWMNGQISQAMAKSKEDLSTAKMGRQLAMAQQTAIDRITDIIDAMKEEKNKAKFNEDPNPSPGGSPGKKPPGKQPLIPPMAQLKLVKAMQTVLNKETVSVDQALETAANPAEKAELKAGAAKVGQSQGELKGVVQKIIDELSKK